MKTHKKYEPKTKKRKKKKKKERKDEWPKGNQQNGSQPSQPRVHRFPQNTYKNLHTWGLASVTMSGRVPLLVAEARECWDTEGAILPCFPPSSYAFSTPSWVGRFRWSPPDCRLELLPLSSRMSSLDPCLLRPFLLRCLQWKKPSNKRHYINGS